MRRHFLAPAPRFGRAGNRLSIGHQQRSPYYWWWQYLRRNTDYIATCSANGQGKLAALYADFGDVRGDDFHKWWTTGERGAVLFAEQPLSVRLGELLTPNEWQAHWSADRVMVIAVPLTVSKKSLKGAFAKLLDSRHTGKRGRTSMAAKKAVSTAKYKLEMNADPKYLQTALDVYDLWLKNQGKPAKERLTQWQIACELKLLREARLKANSNDKHDRLWGRNVLGASVSRYLRQARAMIEGTGSGRFPLK